MAKVLLTTTGSVVGRPIKGPTGKKPVKPKKERNTLKATKSAIQKRKDLLKSI